ncbi:hypothetical protein Tco_0851117 [Tanacetum coccineum]
MMKKLRCVKVGSTYLKIVSKVTQGNEYGFWTEVLEYLRNITKQPGHRTYDMVNEKWKTVRPNVARFCGVYVNGMRRAQSSGAKDEDYFNKVLFDYEAEFEVPFTLLHCINLNVNAGDDDEDEVQVLPRPIDRDKAKGLKKKKVAGSSGLSASNE